MFDYFIFHTLESSCGHRYTVASIGCNMKDRQFSSRQEAKNYMYDYMADRIDRLILLCLEKLGKKD